MSEHVQSSLKRAEPGGESPLLGRHYHTKTFVILLLVAVCTHVADAAWARYTPGRAWPHPQSLSGLASRNWWCSEHPGVNLELASDGAWLHMDDQAWLLHDTNGAVWRRCASTQSDVGTVSVQRNMPRGNELTVQLEDGSAYVLRPCR